MAPPELRHSTRNFLKQSNPSRTGPAFPSKTNSSFQNMSI